MSAGLLISAAVAFTVKTGMAPAADALIALPIPELRGPVRVVDESGKVVPSAVRQDPLGVRHIAFRLKDAEMLKVLDFRAEEFSGPQEDLAEVPGVLPGMNLIANSDFSQVNYAGDPVGWAPSSRGYGIKDDWTDVSRSRVQAKAASIVLRDICLVTYVCGLEPGHVYRLSYEGRVTGNGLGVTMWYQGRRGRLPNDYLPEIANYKTSHGIEPTGEWTTVEDSSFVYFSKASGRTVLNCRALLPNTGSGYLELGARGAVAQIRNLRFEDVTEDSGVKVVINERVKR